MTIKCRLPEPDLLYRDRELPVALEAVYQLEGNEAFQRLVQRLQYKAARLSEEPFSEKTADVMAATNIAKGARLMLKEIDAQLAGMRKSENNGEA